jgi:hypothetical protein
MGFFFCSKVVMSETVFNEHNGNCLEIIRLLASIVKTTKVNLGK